MSPDGIFVAVVGPSGAGKDTLLKGAAAALSRHDDIVFVRRVITRGSDGATEDHDTLDEQAFDAARQGGAFSLSWEANGLRYGLPHSALVQKKAGCAVVANVSRAALSEAVRVFGSVMLIEVTAPPRILAERLSARGRETSQDIMQRLARNAGFTVPSSIVRHVRIDNSGAPDTGTAALAEALLGAREAPIPIGHFAR